MKIVCALEGDRASARELAGRLDENLPRISYHLAILARAHCVRIAETKRQRGIVERLYELTPIASCDTATRRQVPVEDPSPDSGAILREIMDRGVAALRTGEKRGPSENGHLSCMPVVLDQRGWRQVREIMKEARERVAVVKATTASRLAGAGEKGTSGTVALASFELPRGRRTP
jgi:DNA-binding transcriptional ArsR family regulator